MGVPSHLGATTTPFSLAKKAAVRPPARRDVPRLADHTSEIWCRKVVLLFNTTLRCFLAPKHRGLPAVLARGEVTLKLPAEQGQLVLDVGSGDAAPMFLRSLPFRVLLAAPRLAHPCGSLDLEVSQGRLRFRSSQQVAMMGTGVASFEQPFQQKPGEWTLAVSACFGRLSEGFERRTDALLLQRPLKPFLAPWPSKRRRSGAARFTRGQVYSVENFLQPEELKQFRAWVDRCASSVERSDEKNEGEHCLARGCVAYCGLWQMAQSGSVEDMSLFLNVTARSLALVNEALGPKVTAYDYVGRVWPHWATFQHYLPGGMHILHPDTDKGEHCISLAVSFSTHGDDFGGGEIKIYGCPPTVPDCGNRGRARTRVPLEGGPYARRWPNGSVLPLAPGEWLWDGEPESAYTVKDTLRPKSGRAVVWLSETVHQVQPVQWGSRKSLFYWFTCKEPLQDQAFDWSGYAERFLDGGIRSHGATKDVSHQTFGARGALGTKKNIASPSVPSCFAKLFNPNPLTYLKVP